MIHHQRLTELVAVWIGDALTGMDLTYSEVGTGGIRWDVTFQAFPDPSALYGETWIPQLVMYFEIDGPTEGTSVFGVPLVRPYAMTREVVQDLATSAVKDCIKKREDERLQNTDHSG